MAARTFTRRPVVVEALQHTGTVDQTDAITAWMDDSVPSPGAQVIDKARIELETANGSQIADIGDWIVRDPEDGSFHVELDADFQERYLEVRVERA